MLTVASSIDLSCARWFETPPLASATSPCSSRPRLFSVRFSECDLAGDEWEERRYSRPVWLGWWL